MTGPTALDPGRRWRVDAAWPTVRVGSVKIAPYSHLLGGASGGPVHKGGPIWPDWERRTVVRHWVGDRAVDSPPEDFGDDKITEIIDDPAAWCGPICGHFGHMVADFSTRILAYTTLRPLPWFLFGTLPRHGFDHLHQTPAFFQDMLSWYGVPADRVKILSRPTLARRLVCVAQQERLMHVGPGADYLRLLDNNAARQGLAAIQREGMVFVSRAGVKNGFAGERYLEDHLRRAGVTIFRPEDVSLLQQLSVYAHAATLIFSEGSAQHALQLLGHQVGRVHVLRRRPNSRLAAAALRPRCEQLHYHDVGELICGLHPTGQPARAHGLTLLRSARLKPLLDRLGVVAGDWDEQAFQATVEADVQTWLELERGSSRANVAGSMDRILADLQRLGLISHDAG